MRGTIDGAGRLVIPKQLREQLGLRPGEVEILPDGSGIHIEPVADAQVAERGGRLVIPAAGAGINDELVQVLREADQR